MLFCEDTMLRCNRFRALILPVGGTRWWTSAEGHGEVFDHTELFFLKLCLYV